MFFKYFLCCFKKKYNKLPETDFNDIFENV